VRLHLETLFGPGHDFIPVMLYEWRSLDGHQRKVIAAAQRDYEALWTPVLQALAEQGRLRCDLHLARLLIFGALNWSVHWFDKRKRASLDEIAEAAVMLFLQPPSPAPRRSTTRTSHVVEPPPPKTNSIPSRS
jgi:hypothetical protein